MIWIFATIALALLAAYVILAFQNGYRFPDRDKHPDWAMFPKGNNSKVSITPIENLYLSNLQAVPGTSAEYMIFYVTDKDGLGNGIYNFGIINDRGDLKVKYESQDPVFYDDKRIIIPPSRFAADSSDTCDVYNTMTGEFSKQTILPLQLPETLEAFGGDTAAYVKKYQDTFFKNLKGVSSFEDRAIYPGNKNRSRGYILFTDTAGNLYQSKESSMQELYLLCPGCNGYELEGSAYVSGIHAENVRKADEPSLRDNDIRFGYRLIMGSPTGQGGGWYFMVLHTWEMYYTASFGGNTTSFKVEGSEKDESYTKIYQLNKPGTNDPLVIVAQNRIWRLTAK